MIVYISFSIVAIPFYLVFEYLISFHFVLCVCKVKCYNLKGSTAELNAFCVCMCVFVYMYIFVCVWFLLPESVSPFILLFFSLSECDCMCLNVLCILFMCVFVWYFSQISSQIWMSVGAQRRQLNWNRINAGFANSHSFCVLFLFSIRDFFFLLSFLSAVNNNIICNKHFFFFTFI